MSNRSDPHGAKAMLRDSQASVAPTAGRQAAPSVARALMTSSRKRAGGQEHEHGGERWCSRRSRHSPCCVTAWITLLVACACTAGTLALWAGVSSNATQQVRDEVHAQAAVVAAAVGRSLDGPSRGLRYVSSIVSAHAPALSAAAFRAASSQIVEDGPWYAVGEVPPTVAFCPLVAGRDRSAWEAAMASVAGRPSPITQFANASQGAVGGFVNASARDWHVPMALFSIGDRPQFHMFDITSETNVSCGLDVALVLSRNPSRICPRHRAQRNATVNRAMANRCTAYSPPVPLLGDYRFTTLTSVCPVYASSASAASSAAFLSPPTAAPPFMAGFTVEPAPLAVHNATLVGFIASALTRKCDARVVDSTGISTLHAPSRPSTPPCSADAGASCSARGWRAAPAHADHRGPHGHVRSAAAPAADVRCDASAPTAVAASLRRQQRRTGVVCDR